MFRRFESEVEDYRGLGVTIKYAGWYFQVYVRAPCEEGIINLWIGGLVATCWVEGEGGGFRKTMRAGGGGGLVRKNSVSKMEV